MFSVVTKNLTRTVAFTSTRAFTATATTLKTKQYPPSERKLKREKRKEERAQLVQHYKQLDEEADKSAFEKKWNCRLSLFQIHHSPHK